MLCNWGESRCFGFRECSTKERHHFQRFKKPAFGNVTKFAIEDLMYYWGQDKYSAGAYAFYGKEPMV